MNARVAVLLALAPWCASCVAVGFERRAVEHAPSKEARAALQVGEADLGACLASLGAPVDVWEYGQSGMIVAYGWSDVQRLGLSVRIPVTESASASISYDTLDEHLRGLLLFFGEDLKLEVVRDGFLRELHERFGPRRPSLPPSLFPNDPASVAPSAPVNASGQSG